MLNGSKKRYAQGHCFSMSKIKSNCMFLTR